MLTGRCESSPPKAGHHADGQVQRHRLLRPSVGMLGISLAESGIEVCAGTLQEAQQIIATDWFLYYQDHVLK